MKLTLAMPASLLTSSTLCTLLMLFATTVSSPALAAYPDDNREDPDWYHCHEKRDCVMTTGICGDPLSIHQKYKNLYQKWASLNKTKVRCSQYVKPHFPAHPKTDCENGYCSFSDETNP